MRAGYALAALLAGVMAASCASAPPAPPDDSAAPEEAVVAEVVNNSMADVEVYAISSSGRARLGRVPSLESVTLVVPRDLWATGSIRIQTVPVGAVARGYVTSAMQIQGGQRVHVTIESDPALSSWRVDRSDG